jgi:hypothetical protein
VVDGQGPQVILDALRKLDDATDVESTELLALTG